MPLLNREREVAAIDGLLGGARGGGSGALVLRGEPGIGLTTLLEYTVDSARDMNVARVAGVESELRLAYGGVSQLLGPIPEGIDRLPKPQRDALSYALGLVQGDVPDVFLVGLGLLTLLSDAAELKPLLCVVDDAQWVDGPSAQALAFVGRRLQADSIALLFAVQEPTSSRLQFGGLPELQVDGLPDPESAELLGSAVTGVLAPSVRGRLIEETRGNPFALLELAAELTGEQLAGIDLLPDHLPLGERLAETFLSEIRETPPRTQTLLLLAAADPDISPEVFWTAATLLGLSVDDAAPAESERVLRIDDRITFRNPLFSSAIYGGATLGQRRRVHHALAEATDGETDPDRRDWHLAVASIGSDAKLADDVERSAARARGRGDVARAASLLGKAARLTPDPATRARRLLAAAQAELAAGAPGRATALLAEATSHPSDELQGAHGQRLRGEIAAALGQGADSSLLLLGAARAFEPLDPKLARETYLEALEWAIYAGRLGSSQIREVADATRAGGAPSGDPPSVADLLLDGFVALFTTGHEEAVPKLRLALDALRESTELRWFALGCLAAMETWDDDALYDLTTRQVQLAREGGVLTTLSYALDQQGGMADLVTGRFDAARGRFGEAAELSAAIGDARLVGHVGPGEVAVAAWTGPPDEARRLGQASMHQAMSLGLGRYVNLTKKYLAVLELGLGRYDAALNAAREACEDTMICVVTSALPEVIEAAMRTGDSELAASAVEELAGRTQPSGTEWALGVLARSRALVNEGPAAADLYEEAIERLSRSRARPSLARAHLLYGEWLRRERRRREAREHLTRAHDMFLSMGAGPFAERTRIELVATGERLPRRTAEAAAEALTPQEAQIAGLVADGATNQEVAAQLFISPRTVEYHLHKIFRKLDVTSRTQLARAMLERE